MNKIKSIDSPYFIAGIIGFLVTIVTAQILFLEPRILFSHGNPYTRYNNYIIYKQSFFHLLENKDLYLEYLGEQIDYFKYSPSFSLLFFPFAYLPDILGLLVWNLLNAMVLFFALWKLPCKSNTSRLLMIGLILVELLTSIRNSQSNGLIAGLFIFAFLFLEKKKIALASLFIVLSIFIKLFGLVALALFILYPGKLKAALYIIGWTLLIALLPLTVITFSQLTFLFESWFHILQNDLDASYGLSVAGWIYSWFGVESKNLIILIGTTLFCLPFLNYRYFNELKFRMFFLSSILIWVVIFNHKAESPTFVIAVCGVFIWYFYQKTKIENLVLLILAIVLTVLSPTDLFPRSLLNEYVKPYALKAVPCILIWLKISYDLIFYKSESEELKGQFNFLEKDF